MKLKFVIFNYPLNLHNPIRVAQTVALILCLFGSIFDMFVVYARTLFSPSLKCIIGTVFLAFTFRDIIGSYFNQPIKWKNWLVISTMAAGLLAFCVGLLAFKYKLMKKKTESGVALYCIVMHFFASVLFLVDCYAILRLLKKMDLGTWIPPLTMLKKPKVPKPPKVKKPKKDKKAKKEKKEKKVKKEKEPHLKKKKKHRKKKKSKKQEKLPRLEVRTLDGFTFYKDAKNQVYNSKGMHMVLRKAKQGKIFLLDGTRLTRCQLPNGTMFCRDASGNVFNNDGVPLKCIVENGIIVGLDGSRLIEDRINGKKRYRNEAGLTYCCPEETQINVEQTRSARRRAAKAELEAERARIEAAQSEKSRQLAEKLAEEKARAEAEVAEAEREAKEAENKASQAQAETAKIAAESARMAEENARIAKERAQKAAKAREAEARESQIREAKAREAEARESQIREAKAREAEARESQIREAQARESQIREARAREAEAREAQARGTSSKHARAKFIQSPEEYPHRYSEQPGYSQAIPLTRAPDQTSSEFGRVQAEAAATYQTEQDPGRPIPKFGRLHLRQEKGPGLITLQEEIYTMERKIEHVDGQPRRKVSTEKYRAKIIDETYMARQKCPKVCPRVLPETVEELPQITPDCPKTCPQIPVIPKPSPEKYFVCPPSAKPKMPQQVISPPPRVIPFEKPQISPDDQCPKICPPKQKVGPEDTCPKICPPKQRISPEETCPKICPPKQRITPEETCPKICPPKQKISPEDTCPKICPPKHKVSPDDTCPKICPPKETTTHQKSCPEAERCCKCGKRKEPTKDGCVCDKPHHSTKPIDYTTEYERGSITGRSHVKRQTRVHVENVSSAGKCEDECKGVSDKKNTSDQDDQSGSSKRSRAESGQLREEKTTRQEEDSPRQPPAKKKA